MGRRSRSRRRQAEDAKLLHRQSGSAPTAMRSALLFQRQFAFRSLQGAARSAKEELEILKHALAEGTLEICSAPVQNRRQCCTCRGNLKSNFRQTNFRERVRRRPRNETAPPLRKTGSEASAASSLLNGNLTLLLRSASRREEDPGASSRRLPDSRLRRLLLSGPATVCSLRRRCLPQE